MTSTIQFIEDAIAGGYNPMPKGADIFPSLQIGLETALLHQTLLDPLFWQAVGKTRGWLEATTDWPEETPIEDRVFMSWTAPWHEFIVYLADGKTTDEALGAIN